MKNTRSEARRRRLAKLEALAADRCNAHEAALAGELAASLRAELRTEDAQAGDLHQIYIRELQGRLRALALQYARASDRAAYNTIMAGLHHVPTWLVSNYMSKELDAALRYLKRGAPTR